MTIIPQSKEHVKPPIVPCGIPVLDNILAKIKPVKWAEVVKSLKEEKERYAVYVAEQILLTAAGENTPLVEHFETLHHFTGTHFAPIKITTLNKFSTEAAQQCGVPFDTAACCSFVQKVVKQILMSATRLDGGVSEPDTPYINVQNGTLFFDKGGLRFDEHSPQRLIRYCLGFNYDPEAKALLWQEHLDRSLPNPEKQAYLAECLALPFYHGKIEKAAILHGQQNTGKSTTLDVYKALLGTQNCAAVTLAALTRSTDTGDYMRSMLNGKAVCKFRHVRMREVQR